MGIAFFLRESVFIVPAPLFAIASVLFLSIYIIIDTETES
jgi:hypothetical protein